VSSYVVSYFVTGQAAQTQIVIATGTEQVVGLTGLMPQSIYSVQVTAVCSDGRSTGPSASFQLRTFSSCLAHGDACPSGTTASCCSGLSCVQTTPTSGFVCVTRSASPPPSPPPPPPSPHAGYIFTVAGNGSYGSYGGDGGAATSASLYYPYDVALDTDGNFYIADYDNHAVRKVNISTGIISTFAGNGTKGSVGDGGPATSAQLKWPAGVTFDSSGNLYICDFGNNVVRKVDAVTGNISVYAGNYSHSYYGDGGPATLATLDGPNKAKFDTSGNLYIADFNNGVVRMVNTSGYISTVIGDNSKKGNTSGDGGPATLAGFHYPSDIGLDYASGNIYVSDYRGNNVRKVNSSGYISTFAGNGTGAFGGDSGPASSAALNRPNGVTVDTAGNVYVSDLFNNRLRFINATTNIITTVAGNGTGGYSGDGGPASSAEFYEVAGATFDSAGNIYLTDAYNNRIRYYIVS
jgi:sugar lactone lactonase YvrE